MRLYWKKTLSFFGFAALLLSLAACFQSAGGTSSGISIAQAGPTFTPFPTDAPIVQEVVVTATQDPNAIIQSFPTQDQSLSGIAIPTTDSNAGFSIQQSNGSLDPLEMTATYIVQQATDTAGIELTQTAQAIFGIPTATAAPIFATATAGGTVVNGTDCIHEVSASDSNLYRISLKYGVTPQQIATASGLANMNLIYVGQKLTIPGCGTTGAVPPATSVPTNNSTGGTGGPVGQTYVVVQGDTLFKISQRFGVPVTSIANANGISNINLIVINQQLVIPSS
jgi:LysM repeat protein